MQPTNRGRRGGIAVALAGPLMLLPATTTPAKTPGSTYCFHGTCHRVKTIDETRALIGKTLVMHASFYDDPSKDRYNPSNLTSSGEYFRSGMPDNAASPILPDGTKVLVWHPGSRRAIIVRINNAGPYWGSKRLIDLSRAGAERLGFTHSGVAAVHVKVLEAPTQAEATYRRGRSYDPVPGYIGAFASVDEALSDAGHRLATNFERNVPVTVASANEALARLLALQGDHDAGNTVAALAPAQVAALAPPAEMGEAGEHPAMLVAAASPTTADGAEPQDGRIVVASAEPASPADDVASQATAIHTAIVAPTAPAAAARQAPAASQAAAILKFASKPEVKPEAKPAVKPAKPVQLAARAEPKPEVESAKSAKGAASPSASEKTKVPATSKPEKPAKPAQVARKQQGEDDDELPTAPSSAKLVRMAQVSPKPGVQPAPVKIPQATEPQLDRRVWFRTALSMN